MAAPLHVVDRVLTDVSKSTWMIAYLKPLNLAEEEKAFFASSNYTPKFTYRSFPRADALKTRLEAVNITERNSLGNIFRECKDFLLREVKVLKNRGTARFTDVQLYGTPSRSLVHAAKDILKHNPRKPPSQKIYTATQLKRAFEQELHKYGFTGWTIAIKPAVSRVAVSPSKLGVIIKDTAMFSSTDIKSMIVHEIGVHVLRAMNGERQQYQIFASDSIPGYLPTEEGLASLNEKKAGALTSNRLRRFAGRVLSVAGALKGGFRDVYNELLKYDFTPRDAFMLTVRAKRGLKDTSQTGGFIKDHVYLQGKLELEDFVAHGGKLEPLYAAKIGLHHIGLVEQGILKPPTWLPRF